MGKGWPTVHHRSTRPHLSPSSVWFCAGGFQLFILWCCSTLIVYDVHLYESFLKTSRLGRGMTNYFTAGSPKRASYCREITHTSLLSYDTRWLPITYFHELRLHFFVIFGKISKSTFLTTQFMFVNGGMWSFVKLLGHQGCVVPSASWLGFGWSFAKSQLLHIFDCLLHICNLPTPYMDDSNVLQENL